MLEIEQLWKSGSRIPALLTEDLRLQWVDQTRLPAVIEFKEASPKDFEKLFSAIGRLEVRGAPLLGLVGAWGVILIRKALGWSRKADGHINVLREARPTAVNLSWAVDLVKSQKTIEGAILNARVIENSNSSNHAIMAVTSYHEILRCSFKKPLFICNAGSLATGTKYGSSLGGWQLAYEDGYGFYPKIMATAPLNQGLRLTAFEFASMGVECQVTIDSNVANLLREGEVDSVWMGADRISMDAWVANKVGSLMVAVVANYYRVPVYVVAPMSTFDLKVIGHALRTMIEQRDPREVFEWNLNGVTVLNPAFDVVPDKLITAIITEVGIKSPRYIADMFDDEGR